MKRVRAGDAGPLDPDTWNQFIEAAEDYQLRKRLGVVGAKAPRYIPPADRPKVKNNSGGAVRLGEVLEFTGLATTELRQNEMYFLGSTPDLTHVGWGIAREPVPSGDTGEFQIAGACKALVNVVDAAHQYAKPVSGSKVLESAATGPVTIIAKASGTGEKEAAVWISPAPAEEAPPILIQNDTGGDLLRGNIVGLGDSLIDPATDLEDFHTSYLFSGEAPAYEHWRRLAVLLEDIDDGDMGPVVVNGLARCQIDVVDATHNRAIVTNGDSTKLTSGASGPLELLYKESGTGTKWGIVNLAPGALSYVIVQSGSHTVGTSLSTVPLVTVDGDTSMFSVTSGEITVRAQGLYLITFSAAISFPAVASCQDYLAQVQVHLQRDVGSGFATISGMHLHTFFYGPDATPPADTSGSSLGMDQMVSRTGLIYLYAGYSIRLVSEKTEGNNSKTVSVARARLTLNLV
jgi:hypothetical protein